MWVWINLDSVGECQRIQLASELHKEGIIDVMDEPTTGLHMSDIGQIKFEGTPKELLNAKQSLAGAYLNN